METEITQKNDPRNYIGYDLMGFPFNRRYPPNKKMFGETYYGYPTKGEGVLLYDYVVMGYDVEFTYKGEKYYLLNDGEGALTDEKFSLRKKVYESPMSLVENLVIDGKPLLQVAPEITDIEPV